MSDNLRFGSEDNPIRLLNDNSPRELITRCNRIARSGTVSDIDLGKLRGQSDVDPFMVYVMNLISNPNIDEKTLRLGCWLYSDYQADVEEIIYDLTDSEEKLTLKKIGDEDFLYVGNPNTEKYEYFDKSFTNLIKSLAKIHLKFTKPELIKSLTTLHEFYYITATDICYENSYLATEDTGKSVKKIDATTQLAHIHITTAMTNKSIAGKWEPFDKVQTTTP